MNLVSSWRSERIYFNLLFCDQCRRDRRHTYTQLIIMEAIFYDRRNDSPGTRDTPPKNSTKNGEICAMYRNMWCGAARCNGINGKILNECHLLNASQERHRPHVQRNCKNKSIYRAQCVWARCAIAKQFSHSRFSCELRQFTVDHLHWADGVRTLRCRYSLRFFCVCILMSITLIANVQRQLKHTYTHKSQSAGLDRDWKIA